MALAVRTTIVRLALILLLGSSALVAKGATAEQALRLAPIQKGVDYDRPGSDEVAKCTIKAEKIGGHSGWVVRDAGGQILRQFLDNNGDNVVDQWSYFKDGVEVYRDIDSNFNGKADQCRWLNLSGTRWGIEKAEDGTIDSWKAISAEEVVNEAILAIRDKDQARFNRLLLTKGELDLLGLGTQKTKEITDRITAAPNNFTDLTNRQQAITSKATGAHFEATRPSLVPTGTNGSTNDIVVYENVLAMVENDANNNQIQIGALIRFGDNWRLVDAPVINVAGNKAVDLTTVFVPLATKGSAAEASEQAAGAPNEKVRKLLEEVARLDDAIGKAIGTDEAAKLNEQRAQIYQQLAEQSDEKDRPQYLRQLADTVSAAVQSGNYAGGAERLKTLSETLIKDAKTPEQTDLAAYVRFRYLTADYASSLQAPTAEFSKVQPVWLENLEKFAGEFPKSPDSADAMLQLGIAEEFAGHEDQAKKWYKQIVTNFGNSPAAKKALGATTRLESVGKPISFKGRSTTGDNVDLAKYKGKTVLIHYWSTWCEPCKVDIAQLKELQAKYGTNGFALIGVSLDSNRQALDDYLSKNRLPWPQVYEPGGLDSRLANELGILTLPTMILIDADGKVLNRGIHITELDGELKKRFKQLLNVARAFERERFILVCTFRPTRFCRIYRISPADCFACIVAHRRSMAAQLSRHSDVELASIRGAECAKFSDSFWHANRLG